MITFLRRVFRPRSELRRLTHINSVNTKKKTKTKQKLRTKGIMSFTANCLNELK